MVIVTGLILIETYSRVGSGLYSGLISIAMCSSYFSKRPFEWFDDIESTGFGCHGDVTCACTC